MSVRLEGGYACDQRCCEVVVDADLGIGRGNRSRPMYQVFADDACEGHPPGCTCWQPRAMRARFGG